MTVATGEWRRGWPIVLAGLIGMTLMNLHTAALGTLVKPLGDAYGWSRFVVSSGMTINTVLLVIAIPIVAALLPRFGARRIVVAATLLFAAGLIVLGTTGADVRGWYLGWSLLGFAQGGISALIWTTAIARAFDARRGLALAIALSGSGIATLVTPLMTAWAIGAFGLGAPFLILAAVAVFVLLPAMLLLMRGRPTFGRSAGAAPLARSTMDKRRLREVLGLRTLWQLVAISALTAMAIGMTFAHLQAMLRDGGASATQAAISFTAIGPTMIAGRLLTGLLLDRFPARLVAGLSFLLPGLTCILLLGYSGGTASGLLICVVFGFGFGAELDLLAFLTARYFGTLHYPSVYSLVYGTYGLGCGVAAMIGGATYDAFGSYTPSLYALVVCIALAVALTVTLGAEPAVDEQPSDERDDRGVSAVPFAA